MRDRTSGVHCLARLSRAPLARLDLSSCRALLRHGDWCRFLACLRALPPHVGSLRAQWCADVWAYYVSFRLHPKTAPIFSPEFNGFRSVRRPFHVSELHFTASQLETRAPAMSASMDEPAILRTPVRPRHPSLVRTTRPIITIDGHLRSMSPLTSGCPLADCSEPLGGWRAT